MNPQLKLIMKSESLMYLGGKTKLFNSSLELCPSEGSWAVVSCSYNPVCFFVDAFSRLVYPVTLQHVVNNCRIASTDRLLDSNVFLAGVSAAWGKKKLERVKL